MEQNSLTILFHPVKLVVFDLDGTLTRPFLDFKAIRREIEAALANEFSFPMEAPLLERILGLPETPRRRALAILESHETRSAEHSTLNDGALEIVDWLRAACVPAALLTRNRRDVTDAVIAKHGLRLDAVATRDDGPLKPDPRSVLRLVERFRAHVRETLVVGDFRYDIDAGRAAGTRTCLLTNGSPPRFKVEADHVIERLLDLRALVRASR